MASVCKKCCDGEATNCPRCSNSRANCGIGKRVCRYVSKKAVVIKERIN